MLAIDVTTLDDGDLLRLAIAVREERVRRESATLIEAVRTQLVGRYPDRPATKVTFGTDQYDNGHFYSTYGTVTFADAAESNESFDRTAASDALTELSDVCGPLDAAAGLTVNLTTSTVTAD